jgi:hypothetical protein
MLHRRARVLEYYDCNPLGVWRSGIVEVDGHNRRILFSHSKKVDPIIKYLYNRLHIFCYSNKNHIR